MLYFKIKDYDEFKEIFGTCKSTAGTIRNKVLLSFWKTRFLRDGDGRASEIRDCNTLFETVSNQLNSHYSQNSNKICFKIGEKIYYYYSKTYKTPSGLTLCPEDGKSIKLLNAKTNQAVNVKFGRFIKDVLTTANVVIGTPTENFICEEFQRKWEEDYDKFCKDITLHVDDRFDKIYTGKYHAANFGSCMTDKNQYEFYQKSIPCSAAYLENKEGKIVARCILYHHVRTSDGKEHNYVERTYGLSEREKRMLTSKLISEGYADIYKANGVGCRDVEAIMHNGVRLENASVSIPCILYFGDRLSFMDTFKFYDYKTCTAYNVERGLPSERAYRIDHTKDTYTGEDAAIV